MKELKLKEGVKNELQRLILTLPNQFGDIYIKETFTEAQLEKEILMANKIIRHIEEYKERLLNGFIVIGG